MKARPCNYDKRRAVFLLSCWLQGYQVVHIPDVEHCGQLFSDGVGCISQELAQGMAARLGKIGRIPADHVPSAFQIRYAGAKGMVTVHAPLKGRKCAVFLLTAYARACPTRRGWLPMMEMHCTINAGHIIEH